MRPLSLAGYPLLQAMKSDVSVKRVSALAKRLLQSAHNAPPNFACAVLFMVSEVRHQGGDTTGDK